MKEREQWIKKGREKNATHIVVVCGTFDYEDYPVYVDQTQDVSEVRAKYHLKNMQRVMEVIEL